MTITVPPARPAPQDIVLGAALKIGTVTALLHAWAEGDRALNGSDLLAPLHVLREAETQLLNVGWTRVRDGGTL
jgi:hypothetical protein